MSQEAARAFFDAWNKRDFDRAMSHIADDCHYDDFGFVAPHSGKESVRRLFENVAKRAPGVVFVIDDITGDRDVGVLWHVEVAGQRGPRGVSFYKFNTDDRLVWALDAADPGPEHRTSDFHS
ncbi:MAG: nuclear transport factor 2 family protein [Dehalococcoidia bacterium]